MIKKELFCNSDSIITANSKRNPYFTGHSILIENVLGNSDKTEQILTLKRGWTGQIKAV